MKQRELIKALESIKSLIEISETDEIQSNGEAILFGELEGPYPDKFLIVVNGRNNIIEFNNYIQKIWKKDNELYNSITLKSFRLGIVKLMRTSIENKANIEKSNFDDIRSTLLEKETKTFEIFKELKGCSLNSRKPISKYNISIYSWPMHSEHIKIKYKEAFLKNEIYFYHPDDNKTLISIIVQAKESDRADELADFRFKKIESILRYLLTDTAHSNDRCNLYDIGIFDFREQNWLKSVGVTNDSIGAVSKISGTYMDLILKENEIFLYENADKIWNILSSSNPSKIETKILNSIEWIGKAKHEIDSEKAFIQYFFSIESLMNFTEQGVISPSLSYQMCEFISFILGKTENERLELDKTFRHLYSIRSAIVHGNSKDFTSYDLEDAKNLAEKLAKEFLTEDYLYKLSSNENFKELKDLIKKRKYAAC